MKHSRLLFFSFILVFVFATFSGCSDSHSLDMSHGTAWDIVNTEPVYLTEWPENEYTAQIVEPEHGEMDYIYDCSDAGQYAIFLKDFSEVESADYIEALKTQGYAEMFSDGNDVSVGSMLQKENVTLSIAYSGTVFGMVIGIESDT